MKLVDIDAIIAEIESLLDKGKYCDEYDCAHRDGNNAALYALKAKLSTIAAKEVDLDEEIKRFTMSKELYESDSVIKAVAEHFFELGLCIQKGKHVSDKLQKILSEITTRKLYTMDEHMAFYNDQAKEDYRFLSEIEEFIKALQEEPVSQDLEEVAWLYYDKNRLPIPQEWDLCKEFIDFFKAGAQWQKEHLWKPADGEDLPEFEREVVVFTQDFPNDAGIMKVAIAHRPDPKGWDGKSIATGKIEHYTPKTYGKGGWNIPDVVMWLDLDIPKL